MKPYLSIVQYTKPDEDEKSVFIRVSYPSTPEKEQTIIDIEVSPVQQVLLARALLEDFDLNRIENG